MKCTAPCFPTCDQEATHEVKTLGTSSHLGYNCDAHSAWCAQKNPQTSKVDYLVEPLIPVTP